MSYFNGLLKFNFSKLLFKGDGKFYFKTFNILLIITKKKNQKAQETTCFRGINIDISDTIWYFIRINSSQDSKAFVRCFIESNESCFLVLKAFLKIKISLFIKIFNFKDSVW